MAPHIRQRTASVPTGWFSPQDCDIDDFVAVVQDATDPSDYPFADAVANNVLVYGPGIRDRVSDDATRHEVQAELARALLDGPGIVVFAGAFDGAVVDAATAVFNRLLAEQAAGSTVVGDHFAKPGENGRLWSALDKLAAADADVFVDYYANDVLALASEAWLGPNYQVTSQVNVVYPGGTAQVPHRDYHLGFMDSDQAQAYPAQAHLLSPALTLQGAVAHSDMPVESGPTLLLPFSQRYPQGYLAWHLPAFQEYFARHYVQLPLDKGDAIFFNPAVFHGAGTNRTADVARMANLLQVSSAFGRPMETIDTTAICLLVYPVLRRRVVEGASARAVANVVTAAAEGYAFPTNLDSDQPVGSMAPLSQARLLEQALAETWDDEQFRAALTAQQDRRRSPLA